MFLPEFDSAKVRFALKQIKEQELYDLNNRIQEFQLLPRVSWRKHGKNCFSQFMQKWREQSMRPAKSMAIYIFLIPRRENSRLNQK